MFWGFFEIHWSEQMNSSVNSSYFLGSIDNTITESVTLNVFPHQQHLETKPKNQIHNVFLNVHHSNCKSILNGVSGLIFMTIVFEWLCHEIWVFWQKKWFSGLFLGSPGLFLVDTLLNSAYSRNENCRCYRYYMEIYLLQ